MHTLFIEPFPPPTNVHLIVSSRKLTFSWTPPTQECSSLSYFVMASGCGECQVNTTLTSTTCHVGRNFTLPSLCTLKVYTSICGNLTSRDPSTPISIILAGICMKLTSLGHINISYCFS